MKKWSKVASKVFAAATAATLLLGSTVSVMAAGSKTAEVVPVKESEGVYQVSDITESESYQEVEQSAPEVAEAITEVNSGSQNVSEAVASTGTTTISVVDEENDTTTEESVDEALDGYSDLTGFFDLIPLENPVMSPDGTKYMPTLSVPSLSDAVTDVKVLHYSTVRNVWELLTPISVDLVNKEIVVLFEDLSPVVVLAEIDETKAAENATGVSPQTGVSSMSAVYFVVAALLGGVACAVAIGKKRA